MIRREVLKINKERFTQFLKELKQLEDRYGIYISANYVETLDYNWDESPYVSGGDAYLVFSDIEGNEFTLDNLSIDNLTEISK